VLLLDEPVAGVPRASARRSFQTIDALPSDVAVLLIEHDMDLVFKLRPHVTVLVNGAVFAEGDVRTIAADPPGPLGLSREHDLGARGPTPPARGSMPASAVPVGAHRQRTEFAWLSCCGSAA
jgi:energy-coupling factor transporter ATP-binding protein EcfA2